MKVLWSVNTLSPKVAKAVGISYGHAISWVEAMSEKLSRNRDISLAIATTTSEKKLRQAEHEGITYFLLPRDGDLHADWNQVLSDFAPDVIHAYGTEQKHNLPLIRCAEGKVPVVISLQGIITEYEKRYLGGISRKTINRHYSLAEFIFRKGIYSRQKEFRKQSKLEATMLREVKYIEGRSDWDRVMSAQISPDRQYYTCPRMIRRPFFDHHWTGEGIEPHSIFVHQGNYPIKGLHFLLQALAILKKSYPDLKLFISGNDFLLPSTGIKKYVKMGYKEYIKQIIKENGLREHLVFTGYLEADALAAHLTRMQVCVNPSAIENAPNSLAEAMIVGTPAVASYVGGSPEMLDNGRGGYLYRYDEYPMLADRIAHIFENPEEAREKSLYARALARTRHDPDTLESTIIGIYNAVMTDYATKKRI